jgi:hypothetical protein
MKLFGESDDDVSDAAFAANAAPDSVETENGDRPRTHEDDDAIRQPGCSPKGLALQ